MTTETINRITQSARELSKLAELCSSPTTKKELLSSLSATRLKIVGDLDFLRTSEKRRFIQSRNSLVACSNLLEGLGNGIVEGVLSKAVVKEAGATLTNKFIPQLVAGVSSQVDIDQRASGESERIAPAIVERIKVSMSNKDVAEATRTAKTSTSTAGDSVDGTNPFSELDALAKTSRAALPMKLKGEFQVVRVPVVPVFAKYIPSLAEGLVRAGFRAVDIEGFVVLKDQTLLLVSKSKANSQGVQPLAVAVSAVELMTERGDVEYEIVSDMPVPNPRNADLLMFWVLAKSRLSSLMRYLGSNSANIKWGLPLPASTADVDKALVEERSRKDREAEAARQAQLEKLAIEREIAEKARREKQRKAKELQGRQKSERNIQHKESLKQTAPKKEAPVSPEVLSLLTNKFKRR